jgi:hypothetical protein
MVFENHDHTFQRTKPLLRGATNADGIVFLGDGLWGIASRNPDTSRTYLDVANNNHHVHLVTLTASNRTVEAVDLQGNFFGGKLTQSIDGIPTAPAPRLSALSTNSLALAWDTVPRANAYKIIRSDGFSTETVATTYTDTTWTPSSGFSYFIEAINRSGHSTNHPTVAAAPRQIWALTNNLPWDGSMMADSDGDGLVNLLEYFHGLNPNQPSSESPFRAEGLADGVFSAVFRRNAQATDLTARAVWTTSLAAPQPTWSGQGVTIAPLSGAWEGWQRASVPVSEGEQKFLRLEVTE